jgi:hypothetical protein
LENTPPAWWPDARFYYSQIEKPSNDPATVFVAPDVEPITSENPGQPFLNLEPRSRSVHVRTPDGRECGIIRSEGIVPGIRYVMRRNGDLVWTLSVRSFVRKHHALEPAVGDTWTFDTPFYWWQHLTGSVNGVPRLLGRVGPSKRLWSIAVEPGRDTEDVLAAVAFLHRKWWRW